MELLREQLAESLKGGRAHATLQHALEGFPKEHYNTKPPGVPYSFWHLLEHIRRTQQDIVEYITGEDYKEKEWPKDYWPAKDEQATKKEWDETIKGIRKDTETLINAAKNDALARVIAEDHTVLRELLIIIDHNAYHLGAFVMMRRAINKWG